MWDGISFNLVITFRSNDTWREKNCWIAAIEQRLAEEMLPTHGFGSLQVESSSSVVTILLQCPDESRMMVRLALRSLVAMVILPLSWSWGLRLGRGEVCSCKVGNSRLYVSVAMADLGWTASVSWKWCLHLSESLWISSTRKLKC